jgi:hypothetical protein
MVLPGIGPLYVTVKRMFEWTAALVASLQPLP